MPDAAAHAARFDLWAGGETLEAGPTACSMRWRPRAPESLVIPEVTVGTRVVVDETHRLTLADMEAASAAVRALHSPPVDAALEEPDPPRWPRDANGRLIMRPRPVGRDTVDLAEAMDAREEPADVRPWWRRMLGGTS